MPERLIGAAATERPTPKDAIEMSLDAPSRRDVMREAACVAAAFAAASTSSLPAFATARSYGRAQLVDVLGDPLRAQMLKVGEPMLFTYPFVAAPVFLLRLDRAVVTTTDLSTKENRGYASPAGVGPSKSIVAFSAICAHKLMYPTAQISFIGVRSGRGGGEPSHVIHCCGDDSRYDPTRGARVLAGPAPQPLAAVQLEWDESTDHLHAVAVLGGEMFDAFFDKYAFKLETELGAKSRALTGATSVTRPASDYSRQWQRCR